MGATLAGAEAESSLVCQDPGRNSNRNAGQPPGFIAANQRFFARASGVAQVRSWQPHAETLACRNRRRLFTQNAAEHEHSASLAWRPRAKENLKQHSGLCFSKMAPLPTLRALPCREIGLIIQCRIHQPAPRRRGLDLMDLT